MIEKGQRIKLKIHDMGNEGQGIGRAGTLTIFVEGALLGDYVECEIVKLKKRFAHAVLTSMIEPSEDRVEAYCKYADDCGGCPLAALSYQSQLKMKENQVLQAIRRIGKFDHAQVKPIMGMEDPLHYRNKVEMSVDKARIGFYSRRSNRVVDCWECPIQHPISNIIARVIRDFLENGRLNIPLKRVLVRLSERTKEVAIGFKLARPMRRDQLSDGDIELIESLDQEIAAAGMTFESCMLIYPKKKGQEAICIGGRPVIKDMIGDLKLEVSIQSFLQTNLRMTQKLYDQVRQMAGLTKQDVLLDLYCGVGSIGLYCAQDLAYLIGVESVGPAVLDANRNAAINGIVNARFICGRAENVLPDLLTKVDEEDDLPSLVQRASIAIIDPPRAGCDPEVINCISQLPIKRLVYVSCNPSTFARDARLLHERGFELKQLQPVDMFPGSTHVELVAVLENK